MVAHCWIITRWNRDGFYTIEDSVNGRKYGCQRRAEQVADKNPLWRNDTVIRRVIDREPDKIICEQIEENHVYEDNTRNCVNRKRD